MKKGLAKIPLRWRVFLATSITITILFAAAGWGLQRYALTVADRSVRQEIRGSVQAYEAVWKARTQVLSATSALMSVMSDMRRALGTHDQRTIRDSTQELWSRVSNDQSAVFLVLDAEGRLICALGNNGGQLSPAEIPLERVRSQFPRQVAGYVYEGSQLFYVVLTPVYVQSSGEPILLNVFCAGIVSTIALAAELRQLRPVAISRSSVGGRYWLRLWAEMREAVSYRKGLHHRHRTSPFSKLSSLCSGTRLTT